MIEKRTVVDQREVTANGIIQIRFRKELVEDGKVISFEYHRTSLQPGEDIDALMAVVNMHLVKMGCEAVSDYENVRRTAASEHTPDVIKAWGKQRAAKELSK